MNKLLKITWYACLALLAGCIEPYDPKVDNREINLLVVDGFINTSGVTTIKLSRAQTLTTKGGPPPETRAVVFIEEEGGRRYPLTEGAAGTYASAPLQLTPGRPVRLHLTTAGRREYASDYSRALVTPPIDSISFRAGEGKLRLYVNTHDALDQARHFRWSYEETWEFTSRFESQLMYRNNALVPRTDNIYRCWGSELPSTIVLGNTLRLSRNVVAEQPLTVLLDTSPKLFIKYSVLVRQYAVTPEEYAYWELLRKNTEQLGTLFDPLPSQLTGNVRSLSDPAEQVLGWVGAQSMTEQRRFIDRNDLPAGWPLVSGYEGCPLDTIPKPKVFPEPTLEEIIRSFSFGMMVPISYNLTADEYYYSTVDCLDCRKRGNNARPSFWR
ncbi:DUF4249 domain-containing protein [Hymenobacter edaphi]|uniref:DUF4249 domain-containing protein n=1 Tax=Hymenobacter edaphi TaxID=2211146 RepID=A0A328BM75_9BACT|nr:DUF4249 domain-containing protein [Hymenobacter edaphi]RAK67044.1 DUF4249 domain-containing protein [Hymenobacter edaphi]